MEQENLKVRLEIFIESTRHGVFLEHILAMCTDEQCQILFTCKSWREFARKTRVGKS